MRLFSPARRTTASPPPQGILTKGGIPIAQTLPARILVTGAGGFVGSHLCAALVAFDPRPQIIASGLAGNTGNLALDLTDAAAVDAFIERERPDALVHLAAQASVGAAEVDKVAQTWAVNLGGTLNLAMAMARHAPDALVLFASSSEVYGRAFGAEPIDEDATPQPTNAYARSKLMGEQVLAAVLPPTARLVIARAFNHTGPGQREDFVLPSFAGQIARIEAGRQPPVLRVGNLDAARDFLDVRDVVAAYVALLTMSNTLTRSTFNIASGTAQPLGEILEALRGLARVPFAVEVDPARLRASDIPFAAGCSDRLAAATGWAPKVPRDDMLAGLLAAARLRVSRGA